MKTGPHSLCCLLALALVMGAWSPIPLASSEPIKTLEVSVPEPLGRVTASWYPADLAPAGVVILLQDLHAHPEAQARISELIGHLRQAAGVSLVAMEGAAGACDPAAYSDLPDPPSTARIARVLLDEGLFTGAEYYAITHPGQVTLWGVEGATAYREHLRAYQQSLRAQAKLEPLLQQLIAQRAALHARLYPEALRALAERKAAHARGTPGALAEYVNALWREAARQHLDLSAYAHLHGLPQAIQAMTSDQWSVTSERTDRVRQRIDAGALAAEMEGLEQAVRTAGLITPAQRRLERAGRDLDLLDDAIHRRLSAGTYQAYRRRRRTWTAAGLRRRWAALAGPHASGSRADFQRLLEALPAQERFYRLALDRDALLARNTLEAMRAHQAASAVLIAGGFHTPGIAERFRQAGIAYAVITPRVAQPEEGSRYEARMSPHLPSADALHLKLPAAMLAAPAVTNALAASPASLWSRGRERALPVCQAALLLFLDLKERALNWSLRAWPQADVWMQQHAWLLPGLVSVLMGEGPEGLPVLAMTIPQAWLSQQELVAADPARVRQIIQAYDRHEIELRNQQLDLLLLQRKLPMEFAYQDSRDSTPAPDYIGSDYEVVRAIGHQVNQTLEDVIYDLGAGYFSPSIYWALATRAGRVKGIEWAAHRVELALQVKERLGLSHLEVMQGNFLTADLRDGTMFFLFDPWWELTASEAQPLLDRLSHQLRAAAEDHRIVIAISPQHTNIERYLARLDWLRPLQPIRVYHRPQPQVSLFESTLHEPPAGRRHPRRADGSEGTFMAAEGNQAPDGRPEPMRDPTEIGAQAWKERFYAARPSTPSDADLLAAQLRSPSVQVRRAALDRILSHRAAVATAPLLESLADQLGDADPELRRVARQAVNAFGTAAATPAFLSRFARHARQADAVRQQEMLIVMHALGPAVTAAESPLLGMLAKLVGDPRTMVQQEMVSLFQALFYYPGGGIITPELLTPVVGLIMSPEAATSERGLAFFEAMVPERIRDPAFWRQIVSQLRGRVRNEPPVTLAMIEGLGSPEAAGAVINAALRFRTPEGRARSQEEITSALRALQAAQQMTSPSARPPLPLASGRFPIVGLTVQHERGAVRQQVPWGLTTDREQLVRHEQALIRQLWEARFFLPQDYYRALYTRLLLPAEVVQRWTQPYRGQERTKRRFTHPQMDELIYALFSVNNPASRNQVTLPAFRRRALCVLLDQPTPEGVHWILEYDGDSVGLGTDPAYRMLALEFLAELLVRGTDDDATRHLQAVSALYAQGGVHRPRLRDDPWAFDLSLEEFAHPAAHVDSPHDAKCSAVREQIEAYLAEALDVLRRAAPPGASAPPAAPRPSGPIIAQINDPADLSREPGRPTRLSAEHDVVPAARAGRIAAAEWRARTASDREPTDAQIETMLTTWADFVKRARLAARPLEGQAPRSASPSQERLMYDLLLRLQPPFSTSIRRLAPALRVDAEVLFPRFQELRWIFRWAEEHRRLDQWRAAIDQRLRHDPEMRVWFSRYCPWSWPKGAAVSHPQHGAGMISKRSKGAAGGPRLLTIAFGDAERTATQQIFRFDQAWEQGIRLIPQPAEPAAALPGTASSDQDTAQSVPVMVMFPAGLPLEVKAATVREALEAARRQNPGNFNRYFKPAPAGRDIRYPVYRHDDALPDGVLVTDPADRLRSGDRLFVLPPHSGGSGDPTPNPHRPHSISEPEVAWGLVAEAVQQRMTSEAARSP